MYIILIAAIVGVSIWTILTIGKRSISVVLAAGIGTLTNTILFLTLTYLFFGNLFAELFETTRKAIADILVTAGITNGIPELVVSIVLISAIAVAIKPKELKE